MNEWYIYAYYQEGFAEPFYVGKGKGNRAYNHIQPCNINQRNKFHSKLKSLLKAGYTPEIVILSDGLSESEANIEEIRYINYFGRKDLGKGPLLNMTDGGEGSSGYKPTEESILKFKETIRSRTIKPVIVRSEEWKQNLSKRSKGNTYGLNKPAPNRRRIKQSYRGRIIREYDYIRQVSDYGYNVSGVNNVLRGISEKYKGYKWEYINE
jgi:hypothetical protein